MKSANAILEQAIKAAFDEQGHELHGVPATVEQHLEAAALEDVADRLVRGHEDLAVDVVGRRLACVELSEDD